MPEKRESSEGVYGAVPPKQQQQVLDDPDQYPKILGRKA
jgi:hypothetical protein